MKKVLITGAHGMLAHDFIISQKGKFEIIPLGREECNISDFYSICQALEKYTPDVVLNCAAYTAVDDAEDVGNKQNYDINTLGTYYLTKACAIFSTDLIIISTDYVFDGTKETGYNPDDTPHPLNAYGMAKYLGERLATEEYSNTTIVRTSWLYGGGKEYKNFVNTMLKLSETRSELKIINDQFGSPTYTGDLSEALGEVIGNIGDFRGKILQLSGTTSENGVTWFDFASEIFKITDKEIQLVPCTSEEYKTKAIRPKFSKMNNNSSIQMRDWRKGLEEYLSILRQ